MPAYTSVHMHPWFRMPSLKRKTYSTDSSDSASASDADASASEFDGPALHTYGHAREHIQYHSHDRAAPPPPKRRKCDVLESGIAQLSLDPRASWPGAPVNASLNMNGAPIPPQPQPAYAPSWAAQPIAGPSTDPNSWNTQPPIPYPAPVVFPGSVEEPTSPAANPSSGLSPTSRDADASPDIADVTMKGSYQWYEPEKDRTSRSASAPAPATNANANAARKRTAGIVITDLDDSDTSDTEAGAEADAPALRVNAAFMERLRAGTAPIPRGPPPPSDSKALVLFRPLVLNSDSDSNQDKDRRRDAYEGARRDAWAYEDGARRDGIVDEPDAIVEDAYIQRSPPPQQEDDDDAMEIEYL